MAHPREALTVSNVHLPMYSPRAAPKYVLPYHTDSISCLTPLLILPRRGEFPHHKLESPTQTPSNLQPLMLTMHKYHSISLAQNPIITCQIGMSCPRKARPAMCNQSLYIANTLTSTQKDNFLPFSGLAARGKRLGSPTCMSESKKFFKPGVRFLVNVSSAGSVCKRKKISILFSFFFSADVGLWGEKRRKKKKWKNLSESAGVYDQWGGDLFFLSSAFFRE